VARHTKSAAHLIKVVFSLNENAWHGFGSETVWGELVVGNRAKIKNVPFFVEGVSFDDIVLVRRIPGAAEGMFEFDSVLSRSGHSTYRAVRLTASREFESHLDELTTIGCTFERAGRLYAIDVPPSCDIHAAYDVLTRGEVPAFGTYGVPPSEVDTRRLGNHPADGVESTA